MSFYVSFLLFHFLVCVWTLLLLSLGWCKFGLLRFGATSTVFLKSVCRSWKDYCYEISYRSENMRITNVRRGRIIRISACCGILLLLLFALHKWSSDNNFPIVPERQALSDLDGGLYKFHLDVYPVIKTGKLCEIVNSECIEVYCYVAYNAGVSMFSLRQCTLPALGLPA